MKHKSVGSVFARVTIICSIGLLLYGVVVVNYTIPEVAKDYSGFHVYVNESPKEYVLKSGEYKIKFEVTPFEGFIKGIRVISDSVKNIF